MPTDTIQYDIGLCPLNVIVPSRDCYIIFTIFVDGFKLDLNRTDKCLVDLCDSLM